MIPIRDNLYSKERPILVWTIIAINIIVYLWDRNLGLTGPSVVFADLAFRPHQFLLNLTGSGDPLALAKVFTSMYLHGGLPHLIGNLLFLLVFGPNVERAIGSTRFALYYLFWGLVAAGVHTLVNPGSDVPTLGASGAIGGVLGTYFLLFPSSKIEVLVLIYPVVVSSWILLGGWFLWQIMFPQEGVANWAHAGGFLAGMMTILVLGGREKVLKNRGIKEDLLFDEG